jgi:hypothetical protein
MESMLMIGSYSSTVLTYIEETLKVIILLKILLMLPYWEERQWEASVLSNNFKTVW